MKKSVVIPIYNGALYILELLESILNQSMPADEVILVDDVSSDQSVEKVRTFIEDHHLYNWTLYTNTVNLGYTQNYDKAISLATSDCIFLCDQDDVWLPDKIAVMMEVMESDASITSLACSFLPCDEQGEISEVKLVNNRDQNDGRLEWINPKSYIGSNYIRGCTMVFRKEILINKPFPPFKSGFYGHDWWINLQACLQGNNYYINRVLMYYRVHAHNTSFSQGSALKTKSTKDNRILGLHEELMVYPGLLKDTAISSELENEIKKQISFCQRRLKVLETKNGLIWLSLFFSLGLYRKIYRSVSGAIKVWIGDLVYSLKN